MKKSLSLLPCNTARKTMKSQRHTRIHGLRATLCRALFPLAVLLLAVPALGQTYMKNNEYSKGVITRSNEAGGKRMNYVKLTNTSGYFMSEPVDENSSCTYNAHPISGYDISDFTIFNDTLYICGEDANGVGFYGWTSAPNTLNANWTFHIYKLYDNSSTFIDQLLRIRVFRSGSDLNVLLIGMYRQSVLNSYSSILHVKNNNACTLAYVTGECFYDFAILGDYVVTIEEKGGIRYHNGHYMRVLNKNAFSLYDVLFDYSYSYGQIQSIGRLWLQAADVNNFVSVYRDEMGYYFNAFSVSGGNLLFHKYYAVATSIMPTIGDVAYNNQNKSLAILHNEDTSGTVSIFNCTSFPNIILSDARYPRINNVGTDPQTKLLSVAKIPGSTEFVIGGVFHDHPVIWKTASENCKVQRQISVTSANSVIDGSTWVANRTTMTLNQSTYTSYHEYGIWGIYCQSPQFPVLPPVGQGN